jgi:hypothetical protein
MTAASAENDVITPIIAGGRERSLKESTALLHAPGLGLTRVIATCTCLSFVEALRDQLPEL